MKELMNKIKSDAKKKNITGKSISRWIGVSEGMVTKYYKAESDMPAIKFMDLLNFVYEDEGDKVKEYTKTFIQKTDRSDNLQELLEWTANSGDENLISEVHYRIKKSNYLVKDAEIYNIIRLRNMKKISAEQFYLKIEEFKTSENVSVDSKILLKIATLYAFVDMKSYNIIIILSESIMNDLEVLSSDYIKESFEVRILEVLAIASLKRNDLKKVEEISVKLFDPSYLNKFPLPVNAVMCTLAESYLYRDKEKSIKLITQAIKMFKSKNISSHSLRNHVLESTHDFIKIYHGDYKMLFLNDLSERAHYLAKEGYSKEAIAIIEGIEEEQGYLSAYQYYYLGLATNEDKYFHKSLNEFIRQGDTFYSRLSQPISFM
jgi:hypothetical protein